MRTLKFKPIYKQIVEKLKKAKVSDYETDAALICSFVLEIPKLNVKLVEEISKRDFKRIKKLVRQRIKRVPLQHLLEFVNFINLELYVNKNVLIPRFETELLADIIIKSVQKHEKKRPKVLDLCCGSGALGLSIAKNTKAKVMLSDISIKALGVAKYNAKYNELEVDFTRSDLFDNIEEKFDLIVSNPPYIETSDIYTLMPEVRLYEPIIALDGGNDGLYYYKRIVPELKKHLKPNGLVYFEHGKGQENAIKSLLEEYGFSEIEILQDYNGINRFIKAVSKPKERKKWLKS